MFISDFPPKLDTDNVAGKKVN